MEEITPESQQYATTKRPHLFVTGEAWLALWRTLRGMWTDRKVNPIEELDRLRDEWDLNLPPVR